jgi:hypothetical protein
VSPPWRGVGGKGPTGERVPWPSSGQDEAVRARNGRSGISGRLSRSFRLDVGRPYDLAPLLGFVRDELPKVRGREHEFSAPKFSEPCLDIGVREEGVYLLVELFEYFRGSVLGREEANARREAIAGFQPRLRSLAPALSAAAAAPRKSASAFGSEAGPPAAATVRRHAVV